MVIEQLILAMIVLSSGIAYNNGNPGKRESVQYRLVSLS